MPSTSSLKILQFTLRAIMPWTMQNIGNYGSQSTTFVVCDLDNSQNKRLVYLWRQLIF